MGDNGSVNLPTLSLYLQCHNEIMKHGQVTYYSKTNFKQVNTLVDPKQTEGILNPADSTQK